MVIASKLQDHNLSSGLEEVKPGISEAFAGSLGVREDNWTTGVYKSKSGGEGTDRIRSRLDPSPSHISVALETLEDGLPFSTESEAVGWGSRSPAGGSPPYSLDTCDQVRKNNRESYKRTLINALESCKRYGEALSVKACGEDFKVGKCCDCGACPAFPITCDHRLCPDCAARRGVILISEHEVLLKQLRYPKMLTLTFLSVDHLSKAYIKWARNCFTRLRRRKVMAGCWGGIYSFEATHSIFGWHLHIHSIIGSRYIDQAELSREWAKVSGAVVVDIRAVQGKEKWTGIREVVKYPCKASTFLDSPALVNEFLVATEGVNLAYGFGAMYRVKTRRHSEAKMKCPVCGGSNIDFGEGFGFCVPKLLVKKFKGGYLWRSPPV